jgi:crotonobetainyl-CoA:carnitine CoA-transferase CaiB-like acyl-CoA transferase
MAIDGVEAAGGREGRGRVEVTDHPVTRLTRAPNAAQTWPDWIEWTLGQVLLHGNALSLIEYDGAGRPVATRMPLLPITLDGARLPLRSPPPALGAHSRTLLQQLGYADAVIDALCAARVVGEPGDQPAGAPG